MRPRRDGWAWAGVGLAGAVSLALYLVNPAEVSWLCVCPWHAAGAAWCGGCGGLRAVHALLRGEVVEAWRLNPWAAVVFPLALLEALATALGGPHPRRTGGFLIAAAIGLIGHVLWRAG
jgi:hypothetical protein